MKLLIVEDEIQIRKGLSCDVDWSSIGIQMIFSAANGLEGYKVFSREECDIIITDIRMPVMDGLELTRRVKAVSPHTEILIISGFSDFNYAKKAIQFGVLDYELKPLKVAKLLDIVAKAIKKITSREGEKNQLSDDIHQYPSPIRDILDYIQENYKNEGISVKNIAQLYQLSPNYVSRLFSREMGISLTEYINHIRIEHAKELLKRNDLLVYEVSGMVGYSNEFYFMKVFKRLIGKTPNAFRNDI
jgi:two-component system, response regulator YesN